VRRRFPSIWDRDAAAVPRDLVALFLLLLALVPPAAFVEARFSEQFVSQPPAFDQFIAAVDSAAPSTARVLVVDGDLDPHDHLFLRATYDLYPRGAILYSIAAGDVRAGALTLSWTQLMRVARRERAGWLVVWAPPTLGPRDAAGQTATPSVPDPRGWALESPPQGAPPASAVRLRDGWGTLVRVAS